MATETEYDPAITSSFYDSWGAREWDRLERTLADRVNFRVHRELLRQYVRPGDRVLEAGAGPGRFTIELVEIGANVTVGDLSEVQLDLNRRKVTEHGLADRVDSWNRLDIVDLSRFPDGSFDVVVCAGSVLGCVLERIPTAVAELARVTRPGGVLMVSVTSRFGFLRAALRCALELAQKPDQLGAIDKAVWTGDNANIETQDLTTHFFTWQELSDLLTASGCTVADGASTNFLSLHPRLLKDTSLVDDPDVMEAFIRWEIAACRQPGTRDSGSHLIAVARRED